MSNPPTTAALMAEVRAEMARTRLAVGALADAAGMSVDQVSRRLAGKVEPTVSDMLNITSALDLDLSELIARASARVAA